MQEHEQTLALQNTKSLLDRTTDYNKFLEQRLSTIETEASQQKERLHATICLLKKAKEALQQRKIEMDILLIQNNFLKQELEKKNQSLNEEMKLHDQTLQKLTALKAQLKRENSRSPEATETIALESAPIDHELDQYFVYK